MVEEASSSRMGSRLCETNIQQDWFHGFSIRKGYETRTLDIIAVLISEVMDGVENSTLTLLDPRGCGPVVGPIRDVQVSVNDVVE